MLLSEYFCILDEWEEEKKYVAKPLTSDSKRDTEKKDVDSDSEDEIGPPLPPQMKATNSKEGQSKIDDDDDDMVGPPLPPSLKGQVDNSKAHGSENTKSVKLSKIEFDEEDHSDDEDDLVNFILHSIK